MGTKQPSWVHIRTELTSCRQEWEKLQQRENRLAPDEAMLVQTRQICQQIQNQLLAFSRVTASDAPEAQPGDANAAVS